jgi:hypothetical protein
MNTMMNLRFFIKTENFLTKYITSMLLNSTNITELLIKTGDETTAMYLASHRIKENRSGIRILDPVLLDNRICFLLGPRDVTQAVTLPICILKVACSNPGRDTNYPEFSMSLHSHTR